MAYNRADVHCNRKPGFPYESSPDGIIMLPEYPVGFNGPQDPHSIRYRPRTQDVSQEVSCLTYSIYNQEYIRTDLDCVVTDQPDLKSGWNADYDPIWWVQPPSPSTNTDIRTAEGQVTQSLYIATDVDRNPILPADYTCYIEPPLNPFIIPPNYVELYFIVTDDEDLELETEESIEGSEAVLTLEFKTSIDIPDDLLGLEDQNADLQIEQEPLVIEME